MAQQKEFLVILNNVVTIFFEVGFYYIAQAQTHDLSVWAFCILGLDVFTIIPGFLLFALIFNLYP